jgi:hypothetical protein
MGSNVSAVARLADHLDAFWIEADGRVHSTWWHHGQSWAGRFSVGGVFPPAAPVTAVARKRNRLHLFVTGNDGVVYTSWWYEGEPWSGAKDNWMPIGGFFPPGAPVTAVSRRPEKLDLFITGNDGRVYTSWWTHGHPWSGTKDNWTPIGGYFPKGAPIAAVARKPDNLDLFITGNDGRVYTSWWTHGNPWSGTKDNWTPIGGSRGVRITVDRIVVEKAQERGIFSDGDEPYLVAIGFRSRFRTPGSTQVFWSRDVRELGSFPSGRTAQVPPSMGEVFLPGVELVTREALVGGRFPEFFGSFVLVLESDSTPFSAIRALIDRLVAALHNELLELVERGSLVTNLLAPREQLTAEVRQNLAATVRRIQRAFDVSVWEGVALWLASLSDPDDRIGFVGFIFAGVDEVLGGELPSLASPQLQVGPYRPQAVDRVVQGDGARYRLLGAISG